MYDLNNLWNLKGKKNSQRDQIYGYQRWGDSRRGKLEKGDQKIQPPVTRQVSTRDVLYNMMITLNTAIGYTGKLLRM